MDRRPPNLDETPKAIDEDMRQRLEHALARTANPVASAQPRTFVYVEGKQGATAAILCAVVGGEQRAHELFAFSRAATTSEALDTCIDYLDGVIRELARSGEERFLPLDWEGRPFANDVVFVRGEVRDYLAEEQAAQLLGEPTPLRALARGH